MTFPEQILGVPAALVEQGWRLCPADDVIEKWLKSGPRRRWEGATHGLHLLYRPLVTLECTSREMRPSVYSHAGWGDGLAPTPEMVKVWPFWWYRAASEPQPHVVEVFQCDEELKYVSARMHERPIAQARGEWLGPVLPPVEG